MQSKTCSSCKIEKPISGFEPARTYKDGFRGQCRKCRVQWHKEYRKRPSSPRYQNPPFPQRDRERRLQKVFGLTQAGYEALATAQNNSCAICCKPADQCTFKKLVVDHCHDTGRVRGLLCSRCNSGLGLFKDNAHSLANAIAYLGG